MEITPEERENICKIYEEKTNGLIEDWLEDDNGDETNLSAEDIENDDVDGLNKDLKQMLRNCFGKKHKKEISRKTLNYPST